jgi:hypothetical protein
MTVMRGDGKTTSKIGCSPLTARDGARTSSVGRKSGGRRCKAGANTRRTRRTRPRDYRTQTRLRDALPRGGDALTEGVEMSERSREGEWGIARDKFSGEVRDSNPAFGQRTSKGRQRGGTKTAMPVGDKTRDRQRLKREESSGGKRWRWGWGTNDLRLCGERQEPKIRREGFGAG